jgi:hypothetical protein
MSERSQINITTDAPTTEATQATETTQTTTEFGGYASLAELVAAHDALKNPSTEATTATEQTTETTQVSKEIPETTTTTEAEAKETVTGLGLDWDALDKEYTDTGKLSDETYAALEAKGLPKAKVDSYIAGVQAQSDAYDKAVFDAAGGSTEYSALVTWAANSLTHDEKVAFNKAVTSGNAAEAAMAVEALTARRAKTRGTPPPGLINGNKAPTGVQPFRSQAEIAEAMRNPKYKSDPAYRQEVIERLRHSDVI